MATADLRNALAAILPLAQKSQNVPVHHRVRFTYTPDPGGDVLLVMATQTGVMGLARVPIIETITKPDITARRAPHICDVTLEPARKIGQLFHAAATRDSSVVGDTVRVRITTEHITITDVAGLWEGQEHRWPRLAIAATFPDLPGIGGSVLTGSPQPAGMSVALDGTKFGLFTKAAKVFGDPVLVTHTDVDGAVCIRIGAKFVGSIMPTTLADDLAAEAETARQAWSSLLPRLDGPVQTLLADVVEGELDGGDVEDGDTVKGPTGGEQVTGQTDSLEEYRRQQIDKAARFVVARKSAALAALRRHLSEDLAETDRIVTELERIGIVGPAAASGKRKVLAGDAEVSSLLAEAGYAAV